MWKQKYMSMAGGNHRSQETNISLVALISSRALRGNLTLEIAFCFTQSLWLLNQPSTTLLHVPPANRGEDNVGWPCVRVKADYGEALIWRKLVKHKPDCHCISWKYTSDENKYLTSLYLPLKQNMICSNENERRWYAYPTEENHLDCRKNRGATYSSKWYSTN